MSRNWANRSIFICTRHRFKSQPSTLDVHENLNNNAYGRRVVLLNIGDVIAPAEATIQDLQRLFVEFNLVDEIIRRGLLDVLARAAAAATTPAATQSPADKAHQRGREVRRQRHQYRISRRRLHFYFKPRKRKLQLLWRHQVAFTSSSCRRINSSSTIERRKPSTPWEKLSLQSSTLHLVRNPSKILTSVSKKLVKQFFKTTLVVSCLVWKKDRTNKYWCTHTSKSRS